MNESPAKWLRHLGVCILVAFVESRRAHTYTHTQTLTTNRYTKVNSASVKLIKKPNAFDRHYDYYYYYSRTLKPAVRTFLFVFTMLLNCSARYGGVLSLALSVKQLCKLEKHFWFNEKFVKGILWIIFFKKFFGKLASSKREYIDIMVVNRDMTMSILSNANCCCGCCYCWWNIYWFLKVQKQF